MGDELAERVRDPLQQRVERLLGEHVVEDVGKTTVRVEERERLRRIADAAQAGSGQDAEEVSGSGHRAALIHRRDAVVP